MSQLNPGQIQVRNGQFSMDTCTTQTDLIANQAVKPAIREMLELKNKRFLMTLLTSGAVGPYGINNTQMTKIPEVNKDKTFGSDAYRFDVIGRIEQAAIIVSQIGASGADGSFSLLMHDQYLYPKQVVLFGSGFQAWTVGYPTGSSASGYIYNFRSVTGTAFVFSTHVGVNKTCFPMFTANPEGSLRSDSRDKKPDSFINHPTIQRTTGAITGSAKSDILWYSWADTGQEIGWMYQKIQQMNAQFSMQDERHKWFSASTMKNSDGSLRTESSLGLDPETSTPVMIGDGWVEQVSGTNTMVGSGTNGEGTYSDFTDIMKTMQVQSNQVDEITWVCVTGTDGKANASLKCQDGLANQNITLFQNVEQANQAGGAKVSAGYNFERLNINGNSVLFIIHPMLDDAAMFPAKGNDGRLLSSSNYFFMALTGSSRPTMEILAKSANGVNRAFVQAKYVGLTGTSGMVQSEQDADKVAYLKEDVFCVYNPQACGIIYKAA